MASQTQGIQQLLTAEKRASEKVSEARKRKNRRLKQAKEEAQAEIEKYKAEREAQFREHEAKFAGSKVKYYLKNPNDIQSFSKFFSFRVTLRQELTLTPKPGLKP